MCGLEKLDYENVIFHYRACFDIVHLEEHFQ